MPLPLLAWAAIGVTGLFGAGKTIEAISDNSKASDINKEANSIVEKAKKRITSCKDASGKSLQTLGAKKAYVLTGLEGLAGHERFCRLTSRRNSYGSCCADDESCGLAAGGMGMAGGMAVLGGLVAAPALAVLGLFIGASASKNLDNARSNRAKARQFSEEMETAATMCNGIRRRAYMFERLLMRLSWYLNDANNGMRQVIHTYGTDYRNFSQSAKKTVGTSAALAKAVKTILDTPILTDDGKLTSESLTAANSVKECSPRELPLQKVRELLPEHKAYSCTSSL